MQDLGFLMSLETQKFDKSIKKQIENFKKLKDAAGDSGESIEDFGKKTEKIPQRMKKVGRASASANATIIEFSRTIQDAPFGIQGVANNLQQLATNFANLQNSAKAGGQSATELLKKSFTGPAGLIVGVSLATVAIQTLGGVLVKYAKEALQSDAATRRLNSALSNFVATARGQIGTLNALVKASQDLSLSDDARERAIKKINEQYGEYLGNLSKDKIATEEAQKAIKKLNEDLIRAAKIKGVQGAITDVYGELFRTISSDAIDSVDTLDFLQAALSSFGTGNLLPALIGQGLDNQTEGVKKLNKELENLRNIEQDLLNADLEAGGIATGTKPIDIKGRKFRFKAPKLVEVDVLARAFGDEFRKAFDGTIDFVSTLGGNSPFRTGLFEIFEKPLVDGLKNVKPLLSQYETTLREFNQNAAVIIQQGTTDVFAGFAEAIGSAFARGGNLLQAGAASLLSGVGQIAVDLGKLAIGSGIAIEAVRESLKNLVGLPAIAAGAALVAIGSAFKAGAGNIASQFGGGAAVGGSTGNFSNTYSQSSSASFAGSGQVVFRISGQDLVGVLGRNISRNQRLGGDLTFS